VLVERLIELYPTFGYRRLWALLRFGEGLRVNRKALYRLLMLKGWFVHQRSWSKRPKFPFRLLMQMRPVLGHGINLPYLPFDRTVTN
jgi:hypothetical protein